MSDTPDYYDFVGARPGISEAERREKFIHDIKAILESMAESGDMPSSPTHEKWLRDILHESKSILGIEEKAEA